MEEKMFIISFKTQEGIFIMTDRQGVIICYHTEREAFNEFEQKYDQKHSRGYESSMSACIHYMQFNPAVHEISGTQDIIDSGVFANPSSISRVSLRSMAGFASGLRCDGEGALAWRERGKCVSLGTKEGGYV